VISSTEIRPAIKLNLIHNVKFHRPWMSVCGLCYLCRLLSLLLLVQSYAHTLFGLGEISINRVDGSSVAGNASLCTRSLSQADRRQFNLYDKQSHLSTQPRHPPQSPLNECVPWLPWKARSYTASPLMRMMGFFLGFRGWSRPYTGIHFAADRGEDQR